MPPTRKPRNQRPSLGDEHYASLNLQAIVTAPNEVSANETYTDESEEDIYDNREDDSLDPFAHPPRMPRYDFAKRKLSQLIDLMNGPYLDLAPHYQRGVVWTRKAMRLLIDSMRNGYYIPPVIFNVTETRDEYGNMRFRRTCVDGKQRLTSIKEFLNGEFPVRIDKKLWYFRDDSREGESAPRRGKRKLILPDAAREEFMKIEVLCTEYKDLTETQEIELFQRVQLGKPLTQAEAFRATQGSWQDFAKLYERDFADVVNLVKQTRASGFRGILACFSQIYECLDPSQANGVPRLRNSIRSLELLCSNPQSLDKLTKSHLRSVFELFQDLIDLDRSIFEDNGYKNIKTFAPMELIAVSCLLSQKMERPIGMLRGDILVMRTFLRERHPDLRVNPQCWASVWSFIEGLEKMRGAVDGSTIEKNTWNTGGRPRQPRTTQIRATRPSQPSLSSNNPRTSEGITQDGSRHTGTNHVEGLTSQWGMVNRSGQSAPIGPLAGHPDTRTSEGTPANNGEQATQHVFSRLLQGLESDHELASNRRRQQEGGSEGPQNRLTNASDNSAEDAERMVSRGNTTSGRRTTSESWPASPTVGDSSGPASAMAGSSSRKRVALDLGPNSDDLLALEAKRAKLRLSNIKQEKE